MSQYTRVVGRLGRVVLGSYMAVHGAQKLFGSFGGPGLDTAGMGFASMGLKPGKQMATLAAVSELTGGVLTATGVADPLGPIAIAGAMTVAGSVHRKAGPMAAKGGYELPLTNLARAAVLAGPPGIAPKLPPRLSAAILLGAAGLTGYSLYLVLTHRPAPPEPTPMAEPVVA